MERIVIAVGGNSLLKESERQTVANQMKAVWETAFHIAGAAASGNEIVVTHGNGPQVGLLMRRSELSKAEIPETTLDYAVAETQGGIGYQIQQALAEELRRHGINKNVVTVVTQVEVSSSDPAFKNPTKPIGSFMDEKTAKDFALLNGWKITEDSGRGWRRVVASPQPVSIIEKDVIKLLLQEGVLVIACGGGGVPVQKTDEGLVGIEAVIDKDRASAVLAGEIRADTLLISTAVPKVCLNYKKPNEKSLDKITLEQAKKYMEEGHFAKGSMGPKIEASILFLEKGGKRTIITEPTYITKALKNEAGTIITR